MISQEEAYLMIKNHSDVPITYMLETAYGFYTTAEEMLSLNKQSRKISKMEKYLENGKISRLYGGGAGRQTCFPNQTV